MPCPERKEREPVQGPTPALHKGQGPLCPTKDLRKLRKWGYNRDAMEALTPPYKGPDLRHVRTPGVLVLSLSILTVLIGTA